MAEDGPEPVLVVATVTWDRFRDRRVAGGGASYIARACVALGVRAHVLTPAGDDADLGALVGHEVERIAADTQTYRHILDGERRRLDLQQPVGRTVGVEDMPTEWPEPATVILAPLMPEDIDVTGFIDEHPSAEIGLLAQGLQRVVLPNSNTIANRAQPSSVLLDAARPNVSIFLAEDEVRVWPAGMLAHLAVRAARVVVTEGARGATVHDRHGTWHIDPVTADVVDATGAGDTFATAFILGLRAGEQHAGRLAAACAAAAVEVRGPALLPSRAAIEARMQPIDGAHADRRSGGRAADGTPSA